MQYVGGLEYTIPKQANSLRDKIGCFTPITSTPQVQIYLDSRY